MNTRRKRRRVSEAGSYVFTTIKNEYDVGEGPSQEYRLETLPPEVLEMIFRMLPLGDVSASIRMVSRRFSTIATAVLNGAFLAAGTRLNATMNYIESTRLSRATTDSDLFIWSRAFNILELIKAQYKMLKAVTWRYTHPPKSANFHRVCFYAGSLLDELNAILDVARTRPRGLSTSNAASSDTNQTAEVAASYEEISNSSVSSPRVVSFVALCKRFMNFFEKVSECKLNRSALISGCKAIDILDCLAVGRKVTCLRISSGRMRGTRSSMNSSNVGDSSTRINGETMRNRSGNGGLIVTMGLKYVVRRAWFTCLGVPCAPEENSWREDQRFMYLRLRRLVGSVNEHYYEKLHFERDSLLRTTSVIAIGGERRGLPGRLQPSRPPPASTYSGYGVYAGRFFYYGNMNKYAYDSKFKNAGGGVDASSSDESGQDDDSTDEFNENRNVAVSPRRRFPAFDLVIKVELRCSSDLAPLAIISSLRTNELDEYESLVSHLQNENLERGLAEPMEEAVADDPQEKSELYFKINITCPASAANRLPGRFTWEQRGPSHSRRKKSDQRCFN